MDLSDHGELNQFKAPQKGIYYYTKIRILKCSTLTPHPTATSTPLLKDLHNQITPHYAARWRVIGTLLGLPGGTIDIIEQDNVYRSVPCCNDMWSKWLKMDPSASWEKLLEVIESPAVSSDQAPDKGD